MIEGCLYLLFSTIYNILLRFHEKVFLQAVFLLPLSFQMIPKCIEKNVSSYKNPQRLVNVLRKLTHSRLSQVAVALT